MDIPHLPLFFRATVGITIQYHVGTLPWAICFPTTYSSLGVVAFDDFTISSVQPVPATHDMATENACRIVPKRDCYVSKLGK
jgi:hypothetical protein